MFRHARVVGAAVQRLNVSAYGLLRQGYEQAVFGVAEVELDRVAA
jgi:hypothetical protein